MSMSETEITFTPREHDLEQAEVWKDIYDWRQKLAWAKSSIMSLAGAKYYYRGRQRVTDMTIDEAVEIVTAAHVEITNYKASHVKDYGDYTATDWTEYKGTVMARDADLVAPALAKLGEVEAKLADLHREDRELEDEYTGWSRFFLVTSSSGHVHSSMHCSTCRWTTTYGWLPELSGKTEAEAVDELGPALCSVCFPSAPVEHVGGKITKSQAERLAA